MSLPATQVTRVLVVEDDALLGAVVKDILEDEGLAVTVLAPASPAALHAVVRRWAPACILLDGAGRGDYGYSWVEAARLHRLARSIPVIMFSVDGAATTEARAGTSARSQAAAFAGIMEKPFRLDDLVTLVRDVVHRYAPAGPAAGMGEAARRAQYERLHAEVREARRAVAAALVVGTDAADVRRLRDQVRRLSSALGAWHLAKP